MRTLNKHSRPLEDYSNQVGLGLREIVGVWGPLSTEIAKGQCAVDACEGEAKPRAFCEWLATASSPETRAVASCPHILTFSLSDAYQSEAIPINFGSMPVFFPLFPHRACRCTNGYACKTCAGWSLNFHDCAAAVVIAVVVVIVAAAAVVGGRGSEDDYDDNCTENLHTRKLDIHHAYRLLSTSAAECHPVALIVTTSCWYCCCCCWCHVSDDR